MSFRNWQEWHEFMKRLGATCTISNRHFLNEGGCPKCNCKEWAITSDGWAYCKKCGYGQSQDFDINERCYIYTLTQKGEVIEE